MGFIGDLFSSDSENTTTAIAEPWRPAQPYLRDALARIGPAFEQPYEYGPDRVAGFTPNQIEALSALSNQYRAGTPGLDTVRDTITTGTGGGFSGSPADAALGAAAYGGMANPFAALAAPGFAASQAPRPGMDTLGQIAGGAYLSPDSNPYLRGTFDNAADAVTRQFREATMPSINAQFSLAGRGAREGQPAGATYFNAVDQAQDALGRNLNRLATGIYGGAYGQERQLQQQGIGLANDIIGQQLGQGLAFAGFGADTFAGDRATQLGAASGLAGLTRDDYDRQLSTAFAAPDALRGITYGDLEALYNVGGLEQQLQQQQLADQVARFQFNQSEPRNRFLQEFSTLAQAGGLGGSQSNTQQQQDPLGGLRALTGIGALALPFFED